MGTAITNLRYRFSTAGMVMKFIYINIAIFLVLRIIGLVCFFIGIDPMLLVKWIELPSSFATLATSPWTMLTYMFAHYDIFHILFNMLVLYWFGTLFLEMFTPKHFCALYILGGIGGGLLYMLAFLLLPALSGSAAWLIGASASIMAIVIAISMKAPNYKLNLLLFGSVSLKWIAIVYVLIDLLSINGSNMGGHIAHIGGALTGMLFAMLFKRGIDITRPINKLFDNLARIGNPFKRKIKSKSTNQSTYQSPKRFYRGGNTPTGMSKEDEATLDIILDKIKKSGYSALSSEEKSRLFQVSSKKQ